MKPVSAVRWVAASLALAVFLIAFPPSPASAAGTVCRIGGVVVRAEDSSPLAGARVSCLDRQEVTDAEGRFCFTDIPALHPTDLQLSVMNPDGVTVKCLKVTIDSPFLPLAVVKGDRFFVQIINPAVEFEVRLSAPVLTPEGIRDACLACHPWNPCFEGATVEDLREAKRRLPGIFVCDTDLDAYLGNLRTQALEPDGYRVLRYADTHSLTHDVSGAASGEPERYRVPPALKLDKGKTSCDTCHSRHLPTGNRDYLLLPVEKGSALCKECHL